MCAWELGEKREEMGRVRNGIKWKRRETERESRERRALKEKCTACSRCHHFFYTYTIQFFQRRLGFSEKPPTEDVDYSATVTYITFRQRRTMTARTCHTPYSPIIIV